MQKFLLASCLLVLATVVQAQTKVSWSFEAQKVSEQEYDLVFTADVAPGWYIYSQFMGQDGPVPTSFEFAEKTNFELVGDATEQGKRKEGYDELFEMNIVKFGGRVVFKQRVRTNGNSVSGYLEYMTCDDESCLPPQTVDFSFQL